SWAATQPPREIASCPRSPREEVRHNPKNSIPAYRVRFTPYQRTWSRHARWTAKRQDFELISMAASGLASAAASPTRDLQFWDGFDEAYYGKARGVARKSIEGQPKP